MSIRIDSVAKGVTVMLGLAVVIFIGLLLAPLVGALAGLAVGLVLGETLAEVLLALTGTEIELWKLGAFLGFVGGFFRATVTKND